MTKNKLPALYTQEDADRERLERIKADTTGREFALAMLSAFSTRRSLPKSADHIKVMNDALNDFSRLDYSEASNTVETLADIVEHYKALAESLAEQMGNYGLLLNEYGDVSNNVFVLFDGDGEHVLGHSVEILDLSEHEPEDLWEDYIKPYVPLASEREKAWIATTFEEQINREETK